MSIATAGMLAFLFLLARKCEHRRESHSLLFIGLIVLAGIFTGTALAPYNIWLGRISMNIIFGMALGVYSHPLADSFNVKKSHWLYPLEMILGKLFKKKVRVKGKIRTKPIFIIPNFGTKIKTSTSGEAAFYKVAPIAVIVLGGLISAALIYFRIVGWGG
jgi:membrane-bound metal-dependent hydrolase YbcI (DUF457 family)